MTDRDREGRGTRERRDHRAQGREYRNRDRRDARSPPREGMTGIDSRVRGGMRAFDQQYRRKVDELDYIVPRSGYFFEHDDRDVWTGPRGPRRGRQRGFHPYSRPGQHPAPGRDPAPPGQPSHGTGDEVNWEAGWDDAHRTRSQPEGQISSRAQETEEHAGGNQKGASESGGTRITEAGARHDGSVRQETSRRPLVRSTVVASGSVKHAMGEYRRGLEGDMPSVPAAGLEGRGLAQYEAAAPHDDRAPHARPDSQFQEERAPIHQKGREGGVGDQGSRKDDRTTDRARRNNPYPAGVFSKRGGKWGHDMFFEVVAAEGEKPKEA